MSNFLSRLILTSRGAVPTVRPRMQALFEPPRPTGIGITAAEVAMEPVALDHDPSLANVDRSAINFRAPAPTSSRHTPNPTATQPATGFAEAAPLPMTVSPSMTDEQVYATRVESTMSAPRPMPLTENAPQIMASTLEPPSLAGASPVEAFAVQPADHLVVDVEQTPLPAPQRQGKGSQRIAASEMAADRKAAETVSLPAPAVAPLFTSVVTPAEGHTVSKPSSLKQMAEPAFSTGQPAVVGAQPRTVLSADQVMPTSSSPSILSHSAQPRRLTEPVEELAFTQVVPAGRAINGTTTAKTLARGDAPSPNQPEALRAPMFAAAAAEPAPVIRVTIGRIEVRALQPTPVPALRPATRQPDNRLSLEAYLKQSRRAP